MSANAEIHTLAAPYALHALPDDDAELFERHLAACESCRTEVDEIRETAARLGIAVAVSPPPSMKDDVLNRIQQVRPLPPDEESGDHDRRVLQAGARKRAWRRWWGPAATGLAAAMTAGVIALGVQLSDTQQELEQAQQIDAQTRELVTAPDAEMVRAQANGSSGTVIMARSHGAVVVQMSGMDPAPHEHTYQLWFIDSEGARSAGVLGDPHDGALGPFTAEGLDDADHLGVTIEPEGGSEQPTTDPVMLIELPA